MLALMIVKTARARNEALKEFFNFLQITAGIKSK